MAVVAVIAVTAFPPTTNANNVLRVSGDYFSKAPEGDNVYFTLWVSSKDNGTFDTHQTVHPAATRLGTAWTATFIDATFVLPRESARYSFKIVVTVGDSVLGTVLPYDASGPVVLHVDSTKALSGTYDFESMDINNTDTCQLMGIWSLNTT